MASERDKTEKSEGFVRNARNRRPLKRSFPSQCLFHGVGRKANGDEGKQSPPKIIFVRIRSVWWREVYHPVSESVRQFRVER